MTFHSLDVLRNMTDRVVAPGEETDDNGHDDESGNIDPNIRIWNDHVGRKGRAVVMTFRLAMSTPIQLVSKEARFAVKRPLEKLRKSLAAQIYLQRIKEPTQDFLDVVSRSRFAIDAGPVETLFLVKHLPASIKPLVKEMALSLQLWDDVGELWGSCSGDGCEVTNTLCSELPNLRTVAMQVPRSLEEHDDWVAASLHHLHDLLQSKRIDTVRIFHYQGSVEEEEGYGDADEELEKIYRKEFGPRNDVPDPEEVPPCTRHSSSYIETKQREFDVVKVPSWTQWMIEPRFMEKELRARTIEITRWEDTRLGSRTYKHIVESSEDLSEAEATSGAASRAASGAASASASEAN